MFTFGIMNRELIVRSLLTVWVLSCVRSDQEVCLVIRSLQDKTLSRCLEIWDLGASISTSKAKLIAQSHKFYLKSLPQSDHNLHTSEQSFNSSIHLMGSRQVGNGGDYKDLHSQSAVNIFTTNCRCDLAIFSGSQRLHVTEGTFPVLSLAMFITGTLLSSD